MTTKYILILLLVSLQVTAQETYQNNKEKVENAIQAYKKNGKINSHLNTILSNFEASERMDLKDLKKDNVGICILLSEDNPDLIISPAKYTFGNEKINISGIGSQNPSDLTDSMKEYVQTYLTAFESIGSTALFQKLILEEFATEGTLTENKTESIVQEPNTISFIRGDVDWMYVVSIEDDYKNAKKSRIIVYCFKMSFSGASIFNLDNSIKDAEERREIKQSKQEQDRANYPLYHDYRIDDLRMGLKQLLKYEPYKSNQELINVVTKLNEKLDRFSIRNYVKELNYIANLEISEVFLKAHFDDPPRGEYEVENILHLSFHSLGDIYFSEGNYELAKAFYTKAIFTNPLIETSGTTILKDVNRIIYDLAKNAYKVGKKDEAYAFMTALLFDSSIDSKEDINLYFKEQNENKKQFKKDLDKALQTLKKEQNYSYTFTFRGNEVFFIPMLQATVKSFQAVFKSGDFYKSLE